MLDAVVISDIHINSFNCQARALDAFLDDIRKGRLQTRRLILNGDVFDHFDKRVKKHNWRVLSDLRSLADRLELVWVRGNHDATGPAEVVAHLIGADFYEHEYVFESGGRRFVAFHGDRYDEFISAWPLVTAVAAAFYDFIQYIDRSHWLAKHVKRASKSYLRSTETIHRRAAEYAADNGFDVALCGHTHRPVEAVGYYNSGCWTEHPCTYLAIRDGEVELKSFLFEK